MIHSNQDPAVIAGQGTIAMEVLNQVRLSRLAASNADVCADNPFTGTYKTGY